MTMGVRLLNRTSAGPAYLAPGRDPVVNASVGYIDASQGDAQHLVGQGFTAVAFSGHTTERPSSIPMNSMGLRLFIDVDKDVVLAMNQQGQFINILTGAVA
jgi:hypothetical protein